MKPRNKLAAPAFALALVATLSACGVLPKREPTTLFEPARPAGAASADWPAASWSLVVAKPAASSLLDNDRIAVRPGPGEISVYKSSAWTDPVPDLVQNALLRRFEDSGKILTVSRPGAGVRGEFQLQTDLRVFESVYVNGGPQAQVEIFAKLVHTTNGQVVAARSFRQTEAASSESVAAVVDAFGAALGRTTGEIAGWTLQAGAQHQAKR